MKRGGESAAARVLADPALFAACTRDREKTPFALRSYQIEAARALADAVLRGAGDSFAVLFPRQSGKNELQAQLEAYLLFLYAGRGGDIVKICPTFEPQGVNAMRRLERVLRRNVWTAGRWKREQGYIIRLGEARVVFLSGAPESSIMGATASILLQVDEAQDVMIDKFDREIAPMSASTNAPRVFWGTAWTNDTLLAREQRACARLFCVDADAVAAEVPAYREHVAAQIRRLGRANVMIRTQYYCETIDGETGVFTQARLDRMIGTHDVCQRPVPGGRYVLLIDVAGADEDSGRSAREDDEGGQRDATAITICALEQAEDGAGGPLWKVLCREMLINTPLSDQLNHILALNRLWEPARIVLDATGIGSGLSSMLRRNLGSETVFPFMFSASSKSRLGWDFIAMIDSGRYQEHRPLVGLADGTPPRDGLCLDAYGLQKLFFRQFLGCRSQTLPGPDKPLRWSVPENARDAQSGARLHDDLLISAALAAAVDDSLRAYMQEILIIPPPPDEFSRKRSRY